MKTVILNRAWQDHRVTLGMLKIEDVEHNPIYTLENPWLNNEPFKSCILPGEYDCIPHSGADYQGVWRLLDVPGRTNVLVHWQAASC
jgi:hypothetical protein